MKIQLEGRDVYGNELFYPVNDAAQAACSLVNKKTLDARAASLLRQLGHEIEVINNRTI